MHVASALIVSHPIPAWDLEAASLSAVADLVTPLQLSSTDNGRTITLIGAYADVARTVLLFRESPPDLGLPSVIVSDDQGMINAGSSSGPVRSPGVRSDYYVALDDGARPGADGLAHLSIAIGHLTRWTSTGGSVDGNWSFNVALTVQPGQALPAPNQFRLGAWKVTIERLQLTPTVVYLQTLVNGASPVAISGPGNAVFVELVDAAGVPVKSLGGGASITVPKQEVNPVNYQNARTYNTWLRPAAGTYRLRFQGSGARYEVIVVVKS